MHNGTVRVASGSLDVCSLLRVSDKISITWLGSVRVVVPADDLLLSCC